MQKVTLLNRSFSDSSRNAAMKGVSSCEFQCMDSFLNLSFTFFLNKSFQTVYLMYLWGQEQS